MYSRLGTCQRQIKIYELPMTGPGTEQVALNIANVIRRAYDTHTHTHTHSNIFIYVCVCVCWA